MQNGLSIFKSKVSKRIFLLFLLCAMLPIAVLSYVSFTQVSSQLREQSMTRLQSLAKTHGLSILERLSFLETDLDLYKNYFQLWQDESREMELDDIYRERIDKHFTAIFFVSSANVLHPLFGKIESPPKGLPEHSTRRGSMKTLVFFEPDKSMVARIFLAKTITGPDGTKGLLVGEVDPVYLWGTGTDNLLPAMTDVCVMDQSRNLLFSSFPFSEDLSRQIRFDTSSVQTRSLEYSTDSEGYFIGYWPMFLNSMFDGPNLIVVLRNIRSEVFAPLSNFKVLFPLVALLMFWIVLLLSAISIRKSMVPLETLKAGAVRLARRDFDVRVNVSSGDEFEDFAEVFNSSAASLGRQFHAMEVMSEIDGSILSTINTREIINRALTRMNDFFSCDAISLSLIRARQPQIFQTFSFLSRKSGDITEEFLMVSTEDRQKIMDQTDLFLVEAQNGRHTFLPDSACMEAKHFLVLPLFLNSDLTGVISMGHLETHAYSEDDQAYARRISRQVSTALSNAGLVEELEYLNWGTLEALARTVDAKSKWTAGHSERVMELSVKIARVMGCTDREVRELHRAAYLHDIGKIGVPQAILDKPGKLTDEEYDVIKEHPAIGAKILEPIEAYENAIPIVLQHHERYDGKGYPMGLSGAQIILGARILSVADVYDALISSRPYRMGWVKEKVLQLITDESGRQFDPKVVEAFFAAVA